MMVAGVHRVSRGRRGCEFWFTYEARRHRHRRVEHRGLSRYDIPSRKYLGSMICECETSGALMDMLTSDFIREDGVKNLPLLFLFVSAHEIH